MKIPTIFGLSIIFVAISLAVMFHIYNQNKLTSIIQDVDPKNIRITNVTPTSFTINWFTTSATTGSLVYGPTENLGTSQNDDRDSNPIPRKTHITTINNLAPETTYFFKIRSNTLFFPQKPLSVTTPATFPQNGNRPLTGTLTTSDKTSLIDILVFLQADNSADLSTYLDQNLNFMIPLSNLRTTDLKTTITLDPNQPISANILATDSLKNSFILLKLPQFEPIPTIILGQNLELNRSTNPNLPSLLPLN